MEYIHVFEILSQVGAFLGAENAQGKAKQGPQVNRMPGMIPNIG
jgi:hypothetical protein